MLIINRNMFINFLPRHTTFIGTGPSLNINLGLLSVDRVLWTPISTIRDKKNPRFLLPLTEINLDPNFKEKYASFKLQLTGTYNPKAGYGNIYKAIATDTPYHKNHPQFHNRLFAAWDIETLAVAGVERAYIVSWVVSKGNKISTGVKHGFNIEWKTPEGQIQLTKAFLDGLLKSVAEVQKDTPQTLYLYAHNSGLFDLHVLIPYLVKIHAVNSNMMPEIIADGDRDIYQLAIKYCGISIVFRDSMKILPMSLKAVGLNMLAGDVGKLSVNHDMMREVLNRPDYQVLICNWNPYTAKITGSETLWKEFEHPLKYISEYCLQDSIVVVKALKKFSLELNNLGYVVPVKSCITASSIGMKIWKTYFNSYEAPIMQIHLNTSLHGSLNKAYFGGRVEVFNSGLALGKIYHFDVPGLYAGIMRKQLPIGNPTYIAKFKAGITQQDILKFMKELHDTGHVAFFKCRVKTPAQGQLPIPVLPVKHQGKLTFPLGKFVGTWFRAELIKALEYGYELELLEGWVFKAGTPLKSYSETLTELKDKAGAEGNKTLRTVMKLLTNSLYGKFASKYFITTTEVVKSDNLKVINDLFKVNSVTKIDSQFMIVNHDIKPLLNSKADKDIIKNAYTHSTKALADKDLNVAVAAAVTSYGRVQLFELMMEVHKRGGKVCYTDTDSVFATLPKSPFNKPFGPYNWVGPAEEHTFKKSIFLAPKIYYHEDLKGKVTFKVKGVNTKNTDIAFEVLKDLFLSKESVKFLDQVQYRRVPKHEGMGVMITEGLAKAYDLQLNSKRTWVVDLPFAWTEPLVIDGIETSTKAISKLPDCNVDLIVNTIKDSARLSPIKATTDTYTHGDINQYLRDYGSSVNITIPIIKVNDRFSTAWTHALSTAALNTEHFSEKGIDNLQALQILVNDSNRKVWKTVAYFKDRDWIGYKTNTVMEEVLNQITNLNVDYDNAYNWDTLIIKLNFNSIATIAQYSVEMPVYKVRQDIRAATKEYEQSVILKEEMKRVQEKLDALNQYNQTTKQLIDLTLKTYEDIIEKFQSEATIHLFKAVQNKRNLGDADMEYFKVFMKLKPDRNPDDVRITLATTLVQSLKLLLQNAFKIEFHAWAHVFMKVAGIEPRVEAHQRLTIGMIHMAIIEMENAGFFRVFVKGKVVIDFAKNFKTTPFIMDISHKWLDVRQAMYTMGIITKIRFIPKVLKYNPDRLDQTLKSYDKVQQINTYNSTKVFLHPLYRAIINKLMPESREDQAYIIDALELPDNAHWNAFLIEIETIANSMEIIQKFLRAFNQPFFYNNYFADTRGRVYPEMTQFRHIGSKWLRPLFCMEKSYLPIERYPTRLTEVAPHLSKMDRHDMAKYWGLVAEMFKLNIRDYARPMELLKALKALQTKALNPQLTVRILEIEHVINHGYIMFTAPFQVDMKNNAIQHASTIVGNEEAMKATGVIQITEPTDDMYTKVAKSTIDTLNQNPQDPLNREILDLLKPDDPNTIKTLREITKRPTMVIIYAATKITIMEYVFQVLNEKNLILSNDARKLLAEVIINKAFRFLSKEVALMNELKNLINKEIPYIEWSFGKLTDYTVKDTYFKLENKEIKIRHEGKQFHTSYNVVTNKVDTLAMKNALFVNIIHSIDALHLILTTKRLNDKNFFPIHDAYLINWRYNKTDLIQTLSQTFREIHNDHQVFKPMVNRLSQRTGRPIGYTEIITKLQIKATNRLTTGILAN